MKNRMILILGVLAVLVTTLALAQEEKSPATRRAVFSVENLTCGACFSKIDSALLPMEGFGGMGANLFRGMVAVDFIPPLTPEKIGDMITGLGYPATLESVEDLGAQETFASMQSKRGRFGGGCCANRSGSSAQCAGGAAGSAGPSEVPAGTGKSI